MNKLDNIFYKSSGEMAEKLADYIAEMITKELEEQHTALLILPGGRSPQELIVQLAQKKLPWDRVIITTTDERRVPMEDEQSNASQIKRLFASQGIDIGPKHLCSDPPYTPMVTSTVTVIGMGMDAHIASLFPQANNDYDCDEELIEAQAPQPPYDRVSLSMKSLLKTKKLILLVSGKEKWDLCQRVISKEYLHDTPLAELIERAGCNLSLHITEE